MLSKVLGHRREDVLGGALGRAPAKVGPEESGPVDLEEIIACVNKVRREEEEECLEIICGILCSCNEIAKTDHCMSCCALFHVLAGCEVQLDDPLAAVCSVMLIDGEVEIWVNDLFADTFTTADDINHRVHYHGVLPLLLATR